LGASPDRTARPLNGATFIEAVEQNAPLSDEQRQTILMMFRLAAELQANAEAEDDGVKRRQLQARVEERLKARLQAILGQQLWHTAIAGLPVEAFDRIVDVP
jgi:hypothetical protein